jgi:uncharacterized membrane protein YcaP (DUF421 family)
MQGDVFFMVLGFAIMSVAIVSILGYLVLQPLLAFRWSGRWRIAALVPLIVMVPLVVQAAFAAAADSNLWPLWLIFVTPLAFLYLLSLAGMHRRATRAVHS